MQTLSRPNDWIGCIVILSALAKMIRLTEFPHRYRPQSFYKPTYTEDDWRPTHDNAPTAAQVPSISWRCSADSSRNVDPRAAGLRPCPRIASLLFVVRIPRARSNPGPRP